MCDDEDFGGCLLVLLVLAGVFFFGVLIGSSGFNINLSDKTGNKICQDLATYSGMNYSSETISGITAKSKKGELICTLPETPSYDHTTLIKFEEIEK